MARWLAPALALLALLALRRARRAAAAGRRRQEALALLAPCGPASVSAERPRPAPAVAAARGELPADQRPHYDELLGGGEELLGALRRALARYNFGSCGPRGFLGTYSAHLLLERDLEAYYGQPCIAYASYAAALQSSLLALAPDALVRLRGQRAPGLERLREAFRVVDADAEAFLAGGPPEPLRAALARAPLSVWVVFDADATDLARLLAQCRRWRLRSCAVHRFMQPPGGFARAYAAHTGVLVRNGDFDLLVAGFEQAFGLPGGVAAGSALYVGNMRTSAPGYCYSASPPPALCECLRLLMRQALARGGADVRQVRDGVTP